MERSQQLIYEKQMSFRMKVPIIGFIGGFLASLFSYFAFYLNFSRIGPALVLMPFSVGGWKNTYIGQYVSVIIIALISIGVAYIYASLFKKKLRVWIGALFGLILWIIVFYILHPLFPGLKPVHQLDTNTIITSLSVYVVYGVFIGYSISYAYWQIAK